MIIEKAIEVLETEAEGILKLIPKLDDRFIRMTEIITRATGRLIVAGIGKSGLVGRKIVATLNSTGTRSFFLHPVEAMHGDLGMVSPEDVVLALSNSGETEELNLLLPSLRAVGCSIIAFTGNPDSSLARQSEIVIDVGVEKEACEVGAPTTSTTALLAMGDALAVVLMDKKAFKTSDFKRFHPGGALGKRLSGKVRELMLTGEAIPVLSQDTPMRRAVETIDQGRLGAALIVDEQGRLTGIITDGDLRRALQAQKPIFELTAESVMTADPRFVRPDTPAYDALNMMEQHQITVLPICDADKRVCGILHLHDILGKGEFKFNGKAGR